MAMYSIEEKTMTNLANAIRSVNGETRTYTATEMIEAVTTIMDSFSYILVDKSGSEIPAVFVENETLFTAGPNDVREGSIAANGEGVFVGTKEIPSYITTEGTTIITAGKPMVIKPKSGKHQYTKLLAVICPFNKDIDDSVAVEKSCINNGVYPAGSIEKLSTVTIDDVNETIDLGITNEHSTLVLIRYITYKEEY